MFICDTPYQIVNTLNLVINRHKEDEVDLIIVNQFVNAKEITENLKKLSLFQHIFFLERNILPRSKNRICRALYYVVLLFFHRYAIKKHCDWKTYKLIVGQKYDYIYSSVVTSLVFSILFVNKHSSFQLFEDGLGSYQGKLISVFSGGWIGKFSRFFKLDAYSSMAEYLYVYNQSICRAEKAKHLAQMPLWTEELTNVLYQVFKIDPLYVAIKKIILLSRPNDQKNDKHIKEKLLKLLTPWKSDIIVRRHPREEIDDAYDGFFIDEKNEMWELFLHKINMDSVILISFGSTAMITPKMLFNKEPRIIDVSFLLGDTLNTSDNTFDLNSFCNELYENQDRVSFPKNEEEFLSSLTCYYKQVTLID